MEAAVVDPPELQVRGSGEAAQPAADANGPDQGRIAPRGRDPVAAHGYEGPPSDRRPDGVPADAGFIEIRSVRDAPESFDEGVRCDSRHATIVATPRAGAALVRACVRSAARPGGVQDETASVQGASAATSDPPGAVHRMPVDLQAESAGTVVRIADSPVSGGAAAPARPGSVDRSSADLQDGSAETVLQIADSPVTGGVP
ncbi:hypothetical protein [Agromyces sp. ZXT2-3]|uniref:hypothetical protein n=1 Tax=Agromyces sp. ZXT2-3 TaxID=3461152 RepID=UPI004055204C